MEIWDIVDEKGNLSGATIAKGNIFRDRQFHLVVHMWIFNSLGEVLIQKRSENLKSAPGLWAPTGGSVKSKERSIVAAMREVKEELRLKINQEYFNNVARIKRGSQVIDIWFVHADISCDEIEYDRSAVDDVKYVPIDEVKEMILDGRFINNGDEYYKVVFENINKYIIDK